MHLQNFLLQGYTILAVKDRDADLKSEDCFSQAYDRFSNDAAYVYRKVCKFSDARKL